MAASQHGLQEPVEMSFIDNDAATLAPGVEPRILKSENFSDSQGGYVAAQPQPAAVIEYQPNANFVTPIEKLGDEPEFIDCPFCNNRTKTRVQTNHSPMT
ncbi:hypothetical protein LTR08_007105 [Meristemomyces frigidus]|nr:hypothetical protein LTR08_007105 [Meristemomyces frigidus]